MFNRGLTENFIVKAPGDLFPTYVVTDSLFMLLGEEQEEKSGKFFPPVAHPLWSSESAKEHMIMGRLVMGAFLKLPGVSEVKRLVEAGDVIFLGVSSVRRPPLEENETREEAIATSWWHERFHMACSHLQPTLEKEILETVAQSDAEILLRARSNLSKEYPGVSDLWLASEILTYLLTDLCEVFFYNELGVEDFLGNVFPKHSELIQHLRRATKPEEVEVMQLVIKAKRVRYSDSISYLEKVEKAWRAYFFVERYSLKKNDTNNSPGH